jgi:hypothetical protein
MEVCVRVEASIENIKKNFFSVVTRRSSSINVSEGASEAQAASCLRKMDDGDEEIELGF